MKFRIKGLKCVVTEAGAEEITASLHDENGKIGTITNDGYGGPAYAMVKREHVVAWESFAGTGSKEIAFVQDLIDDYEMPGVALREAKRGFPVVALVDLKYADGRTERVYRTYATRDEADEKLAQIIDLERFRIWEAPLAGARS